MKANSVIMLAAFALAICAESRADTSQICDPQALTDAYISMLRVQQEIKEGLRTCLLEPAGSSPIDVSLRECTKNHPDGRIISETQTRFKICADAGSATGAGLVAHVLVDDQLDMMRHVRDLPTNDASDRTTWQRLISDTAQEALKYFKQSYESDPTQASSAEGVGDLLASGDVGPGRNFEALDWYYKAGSEFNKMKLPADVRRQQTTRILEKMASIDRDNPLTKKLEAAIYK